MRRCGGSTNAVTWVIVSTAIPEEMISIKACVAAIVWRAAHQGLNATSSRENRSPSPCVSTTLSGVRLNTPGTGSGPYQRQRQRVGALQSIEIEEAGRDGGDAEGRHEVSRPDAAIES